MDGNDVDIGEFLTGTKRSTDRRYPRRKPSRDRHPLNYGEEDWWHEDIPAQYSGHDPDSERSSNREDITFIVDQRQGQKQIEWIDDDLSFGDGTARRPGDIRRPPDSYISLDSEETWNQSTDDYTLDPVLVSNAEDMDPLPQDPYIEHKYKTCAYYVSYHFPRGSEWGIFISRSCMQRRAHQLRDIILSTFADVYNKPKWWLNFKGLRGDKKRLLEMLAIHSNVSSYDMLFAHEYFHFRFNIFLDIFSSLLTERGLLREPLYPEYCHRIYARMSKSSRGYDEEAIANYAEYFAGLRGIRKALDLLAFAFGEPKKRWGTSGKISEDICPGLYALMKNSPAGYNRFNEVKSMHQSSVDILESSVNAFQIFDPPMRLDEFFELAPVIINNSHTGPGVSVYYY